VDHSVVASGRWGPWYTTGGFPVSAGPAQASFARVRLFDVHLTEPGDGRLDASLSGEIDLSTVAEIESRLQQGLEADPELLVIDLREVTFLDSSGLRLLLRLDERQRGRQGRLVLVRGGRRVERVFELTGADEHLSFVSDPSEAA